MTTQLSPSRTKTLFGAILTAGLIAGAMDGLAAVINFYVATGRGPAPIFKYIASAVFGKAASSGGTAMILWGIVFHLLIALFFTAFFFFLYRRLGLQRINKFVLALLYGIFVWAVMNFLVVPATRIPTGKIQWDKAMLALGILVVCIGLPVSLYANWYYRKRSMGI